MNLPDQQMSEEEYNKLPGIRSTALKYYLKYGARAYWQKYELGLFREANDTDAMRIGRLLHAWILEDRKTWAEPYVGNKRNGEYQDYKRECAEAGLELISEDELDDLTLMRESFFSNNDAVRLLGETVQVERALLFEYAGVECKARLDMWLESDAVVDLKTTKDPTPEKFFYQATNERGWHYSQAHYELAVQSYLETDRDIPYQFIAVENKPPFRCVVHELHEDVIAVARRDVRQALKDIAECRESGEWTEPLAEQIQTYVPSMKWLADNDALAEAI